MLHAFMQSALMTRRMMRDEATKTMPRIKPHTPIIIRVLMTSGSSWELFAQLRMNAINVQAKTAMQAPTHTRNVSIRASEHLRALAPKYFPVQTSQCSASSIKSPRAKREAIHASKHLK